MIKTALLVAIAALWIAVFVVFIWPVRVHAAETKCVPLDKAIASVEARGAVLLDVVPIPGAHVDQIALFTFEGFVMSMMAKDGCLVSLPAPVDAEKDRGQGV